jgi:hypothetical protein
VRGRDLETIPAETVQYLEINPGETPESDPGDRLGQVALPPEHATDWATARSQVWSVFIVSPNRTHTTIEIQSKSKSNKRKTKKHSTKQSNLSPNQLIQANQEKTDKQKS